MSSEALVPVVGSLPDTSRIDAGEDTEEVIPAHKLHKMSKKRWERMILCAYLRTVSGGSTEAVANALGTSQSTITRLCNHPAYDHALSEAEARWVVDATGMARSTLVDAIARGDKDSAHHARWILERTVHELAPPTQRSEVSGSSDLRIIIGSAPAGLIRPDPDGDTGT